jgi:hypothetical protein
MDRKRAGGQNSKIGNLAYKAILALAVGIFMLALFLNNQSNISRMAERNRTKGDAAKTSDASQTGDAATTADASEAGDSAITADISNVGDSEKTSGNLETGGAAFDLYNYDGVSVPFSKFYGNVIFLVFWMDGDLRSKQQLEAFGGLVSSNGGGSRLGGQDGGWTVLNVCVPEAAAGLPAAAGAGVIGGDGDSAAAIASGGSASSSAALAGAPADAAIAAHADAPAAADAGAPGYAAPGGSFPAGIEEGSALADSGTDASPGTGSLISELAGYGLSPAESFFDADASLARLFTVGGYPSTYIFDSAGRLLDYKNTLMDADQIWDALRIALAGSDAV